MLKVQWLSTHDILNSSHSVKENSALSSPHAADSTESHFDDQKPHLSIAECHQQTLQPNHLPHPPEQLAELKALVAAQAAAIENVARRQDDVAAGLNRRIAGIETL